MRTIGFIFAFAVLFLGPSVAGNSGSNDLPGIGTFAFNGSMPESAAPIDQVALR